MCRWTNVTWRHPQMTSPRPHRRRFTGVPRVVALATAAVLAAATAGSPAGAQDGASPTYSDYVQQIIATGSASFTRFDSDKAGQAFDGWQVGASLMRVDRLYTPDISLGLGIGYEHQEIDTKANSGETESDGISIAPGVDIRIMGEDTRISLGGDLAYFWNRSRRGNGAARGNYSSYRATGSVGLHHRETYTLSYDKLVFVEGSARYAHMWFYSDDYFENAGTYVKDQSIDRGTLSFGGRAGLTHYDPMSDRTLTLYGLARYDWDVTSSGGTFAPSASTVERDGLHLGGGLQAQFGPAWFATVQGTATVITEDVDIWSVSGNLGYRF